MFYEYDPHWNNVVLLANSRKVPRRSAAIPTINHGIDTLLPHLTWCINHRRGSKRIIGITGARYSNTSYSFNGSSEYIAFPAPGLLGVGGGSAFTIEAWIIFEEKAGIGTIISNWGSTASKRQYTLRVQDNNTLTFHWAPYSTTTALCTSGVLSTWQWYHVAVTKAGGSTFRLFVNGTQVSSGTSSATPTDTNTTQVGRIVTTMATNYFKGYIDELRVTGGVARYTSNFTPPTTQFPMQ